MKNITIAIDDETYRAARIYAAEMGTSVSALVKAYLQGLSGPVDAADGHLLREMPLSYRAESAPAPSNPAPIGPEGQPYHVNGQWVWTPDGKPRTPGGLKGKIWMTEDFDDWPEDVLASFAAWPYDDPDFDPLPFDDGQIPSI
jgi:hypothetical protein